LRHEAQLRAAARAIYEACYPSEEWAPVEIDETERCGTVHYRQAVEGACMIWKGLYRSIG